MQTLFWKDRSKGQIDPDLFSTKAEALASLVFKESNKKLNNPTQIRKFYDEVLRFKSNTDEFEVLLPYIKMLNAKAAYAMGRDLISKSFKDFISTSIKQIENRDDFEVFANFFEAFIGFYKYNVEKVERPNQRGGKR